MKIPISKNTISEEAYTLGRLNRRWMPEEDKITEFKHIRVEIHQYREKTD